MAMQLGLAAGVLGLLNFVWGFFTWFGEGSGRHKTYYAGYAAISNTGAAIGFGVAAGLIALAVAMDKKSSMLVPAAFATTSLLLEIGFLIGRNNVKEDGESITEVSTGVGLILALVTTALQVIVLVWAWLAASGRMGSSSARGGVAPYAGAYGPTPGFPPPPGAPAAGPYEQSHYEQPHYEQPDYEQPHYDQPHYDQPQATGPTAEEPAAPVPQQEEPPAPPSGPPTGPQPPVQPSGPYAPPGPYPQPSAYPPAQPPGPYPPSPYPQPGQYPPAQPPGYPPAQPGYGPPPGYGSPPP